MDEWMDRWMNKWIGGWMDELMGGWTDGWVEGDIPSKAASWRCNYQHTFFWVKLGVLEVGLMQLRVLDSWRKALGIFLSEE